MMELPSLLKQAVDEFEERIRPLKITGKIVLNFSEGTVGAVDVGTHFQVRNGKAKSTAKSER